MKKSSFFSKNNHLLIFIVVLLFFSLALQANADNSTGGKPDLTISKSVKNLTDNTDWQDSVAADPGERVSFRIEIASTGNERATNVWLKDKLPSGIFYEGDLKVDGIRSSWDIFEGINLGYLNPGVSKVFIYSARIGSEKDFAPGTTTNLVNNAHLSAYQINTREDSATASVYRSPLVSLTFSIDILAKNLSRNTNWQDSIEADPGEKISFSIEIKATGNTIVKNVVVKNILPNRILYKGNLKVGGVSVSGDITSGLNIGEVASGQSKTITFDALVVSKENFNPRTTYLINTTIASNADYTLADISNVIVKRKGGPTDVSTGFTNNKFLDYLLLPLGLASILFLIFKEYLVLVNNYLEGRKEKVVVLRSEKNLQKKINRIKIQEYFSKKS